MGDRSGYIGRAPLGSSEDSTVGIQSGGVIIGDFDTLNFVGAGNTFAFNGTTIDISISGAGAGGTWASTPTGIHTTKNVGIGTTNPRFSLEVGAVGASGTTLYVNGDARITGILTVGPASVTIDGINNSISAGGSVTANQFYGDGSALTGVGIGTDGSVNTTGIITASTFVGNEFIGIGDKLIFSPTVTSFSPTDGATGVSALSTPNIAITFNQSQINLGSGTTIAIRESTSSGTIFESFTVGVSPRVTLSNQTLTIDPTNNLKYDQEYFVVVPVGVVSNEFGGKNGLIDNYNFTTEAGPTLSSVSPTDGATDIPFGSNIVFTFNKNIRAGSGTITLRTASASGTIVESFDVSSSARLTFNNNTLTINPTSDFDVNTVHYVVIPDEAVAGYSGISDYNFTSSNTYTINTYSPTHQAIHVSVSSDIVLTFSEPPSRGTGTITLRKDSVSGSVLESFDAAASNRISISGSVVTFDPASSLEAGKDIYLVIPSGAFVPFTGLNVGGNTPTYKFNTAISVGASYEGGTLIYQNGGTRWIASPQGSESSSVNWSNRNQAASTAQSHTGCTDWFIPTTTQWNTFGPSGQYQWTTNPSPPFWSDTEINSTHAYAVYKRGNCYARGFRKTYLCRARAFRTVSY